MSYDIETKEINIARCVARILHWGQEATKAVRVNFFIKKVDKLYFFSNKVTTFFKSSPSKLDLTQQRVHIFFYILEARKTLLVERTA